MSLEENKAVTRGELSMNGMNSTRWPSSPSLGSWTGPGAEKPFAHEKDRRLGASTVFRAFASSQEDQVEAMEAVQER